MGGILAYGNTYQPNDWTTEQRSQFCSFAAVAAPPPVPMMPPPAFMPGYPMPYPPPA